MDGCFQGGGKLYTPPVRKRRVRMGHPSFWGWERGKNLRVGHPPAVVVEVGKSAVTTEGEEVVATCGLVALEAARHSGTIVDIVEVGSVCSWLHVLLTSPPV
jgi:hypothetical protein